MPDWNFEVEEAEDDDDLGRNQESSRDSAVLIVDGSAKMFQELMDSESEDETTKPKPCFCFAMDAVYEYMCRKCVSVSRDCIGVIIANTEKTQNDHQFKNMVALQKVACPGTERVKEIDSFRDPETVQKRFDKAFGGHAECQWQELLWLAQFMINESPNSGTKRVFLLTNCDSPASNSQADQVGLKRKIGDLEEADIKLEVVPLGSKFQAELYWNKALKRDLKSSATLEELLSSVRRKEYKKRSIGNISLKLGGDVELSLGIYNLLQKATVPGSVNLNKKTNEEVRPKTSFFDPESGEKLLTKDIMKVQNFGGRDIALEADEVEHLRRISPPGLVLLGFKPLHALKLYHHIRPAVFIYPDDKTIRGSVKLFRVLLERCLARRVMPICRMTARRNMAPRIVALMPQEEKLDSDGSQLQPPGFHAIYLPYADDIRSLDAVIVPSPELEETKVEAAKQMIKKLERFANDDQAFDPDNFNNPVIEQHYRAVEAVALEREEMPEVKDLTKPNVEWMQRKAGEEMKNFMDAIFPEGYEPGSKRKSPGSAAGRAKKANLDDNVNLEELAANGKLGTLTVPHLKELAKANGIPLGVTKKADIIEKIAKHYN